MSPYIDDICAHSACNEPAAPGLDYCVPHQEMADAEWDRLTARAARKAGTA